VADHQERFAGGQRHRFARLECHALSLERLGADGLVQLAIGLGRQRDQNDGDVVVAILVAEEVLARRQSGRRRKPDTGAGRINRLGGTRRGQSQREHK